METRKRNFKILIPNLFTAFSLISGLFALQFTFEREFVIASWLIALSMLCDGLDGKLARYLNASSRFGALFDTLSDFVAFGVVPGFLAYKAGLYKIQYWGAIIAIFYVFSGGYRLIRFILKDNKKELKKSFIGLPIPAAAGLIASFIIFNFYYFKDILSPELFIIIVFFSSILMVSKIEYLKIEKRTKLSKESKFFILLALLSIIAALKYSFLVFGGWILIYTLYGILRQIIFSISKKK
ncbi:MAG: CDP-diacylglycerol--serine O-phosphatidyltransferase [Candidatus Cloacimonetes bacterium]|jgi:CDP-diacylglycerol--serine O-phosphatidyltransferase|nr:CDP-diacylglycerol--serine O-phosphatidyltransferase [Candidatus Cloacimonadota bacterium]